MMVVEKVDFPFLHMQELRGNIKTLKILSSRHFAPIQSDAGTSWDMDVVNACDYGIKLMQNELDKLEEKRKELYKHLDEKYGVKDKDYIVTFDGSVHVGNINS